MNTKIALVLFVCTTLSQNLLAAGKTGPCTPPTGTIDISPNQTCNGHPTVAIGGTLTLTGKNLADKDCYCGQPIQDSINPQTHVKWGGATQQFGSFTGTNGNVGSPATWVAPSDTHTAFIVRILLQNDNTIQNTSDDGPFAEPANSAVQNLDVVIPNTDSWATQSAACPASAPTGYYHQLTDTVNRTGCTVDFSGLFIWESTQANVIQDDCGLLGNAQYGSQPTALGQQNVPSAFNDTDVNCCGFSAKLPANCVSKVTTKWMISTKNDGSGGIQFMSRTYTATNGAQVGNCNGLTSSLSATYP